MAVAVALTVYFSNFVCTWNAVYYDISFEFSSLIILCVSICDQKKSNFCIERSPDIHDAVAAGNYNIFFFKI